MQTFDIVSKKRRKHRPCVNRSNDVILWYDFDHESQSGDYTTILQSDGQSRESSRNEKSDHIKTSGLNSGYSSCRHRR